MTLDYNKIIESLYNNFGLPDEISEHKTKLLVRFSNFFVTIITSGDYVWGNWEKAEKGIRCSGSYRYKYTLLIKLCEGDNGLVCRKEFMDDKIPELMKAVDGISEIFR